MPNLYANPRPFAEEDAVAPALSAPHPSTLAAQESINPIPKLLLSFPIPQMISQMHLETAWSREDDTPAGATADVTVQRAEWGTEKLDNMVSGMQHSVQHLLLTGSYSHFFQEQFHHEVTLHTMEADEDLHNAGRTAAPSQAVRHISTVAAPGIKKLLYSMGQQRTVVGAPLFRTAHGELPQSSTTLSSSGNNTSRPRVPLTPVPKTEVWVRNDEGPPMNLRPRHSSGFGCAWADAPTGSLDSAGGGGSAGTTALTSAPRRGGAMASSSTSLGVVQLAGNRCEPRTSAPGTNYGALGLTPVHDGSASTSFAEWVCHQQSTGFTEATVAPLLHFTSALPLQFRPFDGIEREQLSNFLSSLVVDSSKEDSDALRRSARGLLCCQCLAHPHFPIEAVPDGLMGRAIDLFARLVRDVSALLQEEQQKSAGAARVKKENEEDREKRRTPVVGRHSGISASSSTTTAPAGTSALLSLLEQLRGFIGTFALILCNAHLRLVMDADVLRLEELCHHCLFRLTRTCTKELHALYSSYTVDIAVHLYRCVWNHLNVQRQHIVESFFKQLPVSELLTQRTYHTHFDGRAVLPLTVAMLAAVQSFPLPPHAVGAAGAETLQRQCGLWANGFLQAFLLSNPSERDKAADAVAWTAAIRVAEDLVDLLSVPEWPGADLFLRSFLLELAQLTLGSEKTASSSPGEAPRPLAIDVVGHVAVKLFDVQHFPVASAIVEEMERLGESTNSSQAAARMALQHVGSSSVPSLPPDDPLLWEQLCGDRADGPEEDHQLQDLIAAVYMAESRFIANPSTAVDYASAWFHVRAARLMAWACLHDAAGPKWIPPASLDALVRWKGQPTDRKTNISDQYTNWGDVCAWTQAISTQSGKSMLSLRMRHTLISMLFSVFHLKDTQEAAISVTEVMQKKTLAHLERLTKLHPPLHRYLWPIVRQCVRDDSARVRESIVPLLLTLLNDAAEAEVNTDASNTGQLPALSPKGITAEVISSLLHLLGDKSVSVVLRTIAALDTFLTDQSYHYLFSTPQGTSLLSFIQQKLLFFASPTAELKYRQEVVNHFLHRWVVTLADSDGFLTGAHAQLAKELVTLTVKGAPDFPYDVTEEHLLVQLLQRMHAHVSAHDTSIEASRRVVTATVVATPHSKRRSRGCHVDADQLLHVMRCASQSLWMRYQCFHSSEDAVACLATLRALTLARSEWVMPLAEVVVQSLAYPPPTTSPLASAPDALGGSLLQLCQILHVVLHAPKLPLISLNYLSRCLTTLLSKYVGPYQQRVIVASCGALCALITCGAKHRLSAQVNVPYLQLCYSLMNTYYSRVRALLPTLATQPQSVAYTQRFLFLLSEFLRMYPEWRQQPPHPALLDDAVCSGSGGTSPLPNQLVKGLGIMANTYQLLEDVLQSCGNGGTRERVAVITLRVVASLCMLDPITYFYRAETQIRSALASPDHNLQLQGLSLLSDFLKEEDKRVDAAAHNATRLDTTALILGTRESASTSRSGSHSSEEARSAERSRTTEKAAVASTATRRGGKAKQARRESAIAASGTTRTQFGKAKQVAVASTTTEDFNSGMSTWVFQQFHSDIARLGCSSPHASVRSLCLRLFQQAAQGGLLPPDKYAKVIIALAADVHPSLRLQATASLAAHCDRHEEVMAAAVGRGVVLAFDLHHACGAHLLRSAVVPLSSQPGLAETIHDSSERSVHSALYTLLHKRSRDNMITTLVRFFSQDGKVLHWCAEHREELAVWASPLTATAAIASPAGIFGVVHPLLFLSHLTLVLFALPFQHESDVMHLLQQCQTALDLNGQSALDWLKDTDVDVVAGSGMVMQWKVIGTLLLYYLRRALLAEYRLVPTRVKRYHAREERSRPVGSGNGSAPLRRRDTSEGEGTAAALMKRLQELVGKMGAALVASLGEEGRAVRTAVWQHVSAELEAALMTETVEGAGRRGAASTGGRARKKTCSDGRNSEKTVKPGKRGPARKRTRARLSSSEETPSSTEDSDEELTSPSTSLSESDSAMRATSTASSSPSSATSLSHASVDRLSEEEERDA